ncbi:hypothetical protein BU14_0482s0004 [Porphyra umbilicalis]|uniref:Uncharacterized protein n=1 Tax=Porphyra umbilicalis TaxID=2786 RepID=A0A1X6NU26_PORUM|nr:hypothetical protein BU14_0482s0004 [Porphyra umbilicalis]|eukprot:OSX72010.1 hypothetical protein BU14_0482s0004 [Porphyra umbilicalis]
MLFTLLWMAASFCIFMRGVFPSSFKFSAAVCLELKRTSVRVHKGYNAYCFVRLCMCLWFALLLAHLVLLRSCCLCSDSRATHRLLLMQLRTARDKRSGAGDALW